MNRLSTTSSVPLNSQIPDQLSLPSLVNYDLCAYSGKETLLAILGTGRSFIKLSIAEQLAYKYPENFSRFTQKIYNSNVEQASNALALDFLPNSSSLDLRNAKRKDYFSLGFHLANYTTFNQEIIDSARTYLPCGRTDQISKYFSIHQEKKYFDGRLAARDSLLFSRNFFFENLNEPNSTKLFLCPNHKREEDLADYIPRRLIDTPLVQYALTRGISSAPHRLWLPIIGDAVLAFATEILNTESLRRSKPDKKETIDFSVMRKNSYLKTLCERFGIVYLNKTPNQLDFKNGEQKGEAEYGTAMEALIGALWLEGGIEQILSMFIKLAQAKIGFEDTKNREKNRGGYKFERRKARAELEKQVNDYRRSQH